MFTLPIMETALESFRAEQMITSLYQTNPLPPLNHSLKVIHDENDKVRKI